MSKLSRRNLIQASLGAALVRFVPTIWLQEPALAAVDTVDSSLKLDTSAPAPVNSDGFHMGSARRRNGDSITVDSRSLRRNGKPWLPVMGEFHFSRYPQAEWARELRKMRAGGIDLVSTYVFWIHHEEVENQWDWSGRRSLSGFAAACRDAGLPLIVRCGPWSHGEARNGGFPDWLLHKGYPLRSEDPRYLDETRKLYAQISSQLRGLLWKEGGPVVGIQCENEYSGSAQHLLTLKKIAGEAGLDVPIYTRTGWPELSSPMPFGETLPLFGSYCDGFWDRELTPLPGRYGDAFLFLLARGATTAAIGTDQLGAGRRDGARVGSYPYCCCEIGGGMETSYHRRVRIAPMDIEATALVKIGSGNNLQGYYMYHGGTNPDGKLSTMQESQATGYPNDLPVKSYDFFAPLGEFGQVNEHYHRLRRMHLFLNDWGSELAQMAPFVPAKTPSGSGDRTTLRWAARSDGESGIVFINNYERLQSMPAKSDVKFDIGLTDERLTFPENPVTIPADRAFFWPFRLDVGAAVLRYATAQPLCRIVDEHGLHTIVFARTGTPAEFVFDGADFEMERSAGDLEHLPNKVAVRHVRTGTDAALRLRSKRGATAIVLLDESESLACWKLKLAGSEYTLLSRANLSADGEYLEAAVDDSGTVSVALLPAPQAVTFHGQPVRGRTDGVFCRYEVHLPAVEPITASIEKITSEGPARIVPIGRQGVAEAPSDADFDKAACWRIVLSEGFQPGRDVRLRIHYRGDVARLYLGDRLIDDNFYNGQSFEVGLDRYAPEIYHQELVLKVTPLRKDAPIYLGNKDWPEFGLDQSIAAVDRIDVVETRRVRLHVDAKKGVKGA